MTDSAIAEILAQLERVRSEPVPAAELEAAKSYLIGSFPLRIQTAGQIAGQVATTVLLGRDLQDLTTYRERVRAVTAADIQRVAREYVRPDRAAIVVVGDAPRVLPMVERIAPVSLYDVEGRSLERSAFEVAAPTARFDASSLRPMTLTWGIVAQGNTVGTATSQLTREGEVWVDRTAVPLMGQQGELRFRSDFTPVSATQTMRQGPTTVSVDLAMANGRITGTGTFPAQMGGEKSYDLEAVPGTLLPGMDSWVLATADLSPGAVITVPYFNAMTGSVGNVTYTVTGTEEVTVPAGTYQTYRVEIAGPQQMVVFVRTEAPHITVKQEFVGQPVTLELQSIE